VARTWGFPHGLSLNAEAGRTRRIWDPQSDRTICILGSPFSLILASDWRADEGVLATSHIFGMLALWDTTSGERVRAFPIRLETVRLPWRPDSQNIACMTVGCLVSEWDAITGVLQFDWRAPSGTPADTQRHSCESHGLVAGGDDEIGHVEGAGANIKPPGQTSSWATPAPGSREAQASRPPTIPAR
jgi:hypothetical protein